MDWNIPMTASPNPFADDPQPPERVRLHSAADPLDPYAAPAAAADDQTDKPLLGAMETGLWRQGRLIVMQHGAQFPTRCVLTNAPTKNRTPRALPRGYVIDLGWKPRIIVPYAIANHALWWLMMIRIVALGSVLMIVFAVRQFVWVSYSSWVFLLQSGIVIFLAIPMVGLVLLAMALAKMAIDALHPLRIVVSDGEFSWLYGGGHDFLNSLPPWPGKVRQRSQ
jgi:hypothetical protein